MQSHQLYCFCLPNIVHGDDDEINLLACLRQTNTCNMLSIRLRLKHMAMPMAMAIYVNEYDYVHTINVVSI